VREDAAGKYNPTLKVNVVLGADASKAVRVLTARRLPNGKVTKPVPVAHPQTSRLRRASLRLMRAAARGALRLHSDQIECTEATCGPADAKGL
jgi:hypothetical protein